MESAVVDTATVIALVPDRAPARPDSALKTARAVASRFGYVLQVLLAGQLQRIVDRRHVAVYQVPKTFRAGYIIIVPSRRPRFVQGFFGADRLAREIGEYEQLVHRLTLR